MSTATERTLNWLYSVLTNEYHDPNQTYSHVAGLLTRYPSTFKLRTEVYTYETGKIALLVNLFGHLTVDYRGSLLRVPVSIWLPHAYPREAPLVYVVPDQGSVVVPGNHVSGEGRVYHRYLAQWTDAWDRNSVADLVEVLKIVFAKEAPVSTGYGYQTRSTQAQHDPSRSVPPPVPPPPDGRGSRQPQASRYANGGSLSSSPAPPLPPKSTHAGGEGAPSAQERRRVDGPPLPPLPPGAQVRNSYGATPQQGTYPSPAPRQPASGQSSQYNGFSRGDHIPIHMRQHMQSPQQSQAADQPPSPFSTFPDSSRGAIHNQHQAFTPSQGGSTYQNAPRSHPHHIAQQAYPTSQAPAQPQVQPYPSSVSPSQRYAFSQSQQLGGQPTLPVQQPKPVDLLSSPLDVTLPSQNSANQDTLPLPPVPPNPQKDALLTALAQTLNQQITSTLAANATAAGSLVAQNQSLQVAMSRLQAELRGMEVLEQEINSNERILRDTMREADRVMADAKARRRPEVDDVLVAPTIVANQLYREAAEIEALVESRALLTKALDNGTVGVQEWSRMVRNLAREEFSKRALVRKIGQGMGLDDGNETGKVRTVGTVGLEQSSAEGFYAGYG